jgi:hypothetical protein
MDTQDRTLVIVDLSEHDVRTAVERAAIEFARSLKKDLLFEGVLSVDHDSTGYGFTVTLLPSRVRATEKEM